MIQRLEKLKDEIHSEDETSVIKIALEDMSAADSLCEKLEPVSEKYPYLRFLFYTDKLLQKAETKTETAAAAANQLVKLLNRDIVFYGE